MGLMGFKKSESPKTKKAKKPKKKSLGRLHKKLAELCQKWARISNADANGYCVCYTCGKVDHYKKMDGGHFIPKTKYPTRYHWMNINPQCKRCNKWLHGNLTEYEDALVKDYGRKAVDAMKSESKQTAKIHYKRDWLEQQIINYDREIRILEKGLPS